MSLTYLYDNPNGKRQNHGAESAYGMFEPRLLLQTSAFTFDAALGLRSLGAETEKDGGDTQSNVDLKTSKKKCS